MKTMLIFGGILLIIAGVVVPVAGVFTALLSDDFTTSLDSALNAEQAAAQYCDPGETLTTDEGVSQYTPGQGYAHTVRYFCVDDEGNRREITGSVAQEIVGDAVSGATSMITATVSGGLVGCLLTPFGVVLIVAGFLSGRRARAAAAGVSSGFGPALEKPKRKTSDPDSQTAAKLQRIDDLRAKNLITQEEYERLRRQILDALA